MLLFGYFFVLAATVVAIPSPSVVTNGERLARNLPPLPPKYGRTLPGHVRSVDDPTPVHVARASPSASPVISYTGRIEVRSPKNDTKIGYLENAQRGFDGINFGGDEDLYVSFKATASGKGLFDIVAQKPNFKGPPYLGGASSNSSAKLSADSADTVNFVNVDQTPRHSRPVNVNGGFEESAIWSIDPHTKRITPHWINPDGRSAPTVIAYDIRENNIFLVGDIDTYNHANSIPASAVEFFFASN